MPAAHFIAAALERRTANHHPCPLLKGGELRGRKANKLRSAAHLSASHSPAPQPPRPAPSANPNIPRAPNCRLDFISPSGPLSRHRERGWGERADAPVATLGAILCAVRIDFGLPSKINPYPAQPATGVLGQSPKRVLVPFTRVKGTPRRRAVQDVTYR